MDVIDQPPTEPPSLSAELTSVADCAAFAFDSTVDAAVEPMFTVPSIVNVEPLKVNFPFAKLSVPIFPTLFKSKPDELILKLLFEELT